MSGRQQYSQKQIIDALTQARGLKSPAARALGCSRHTISRYIERYPAVRQAYEDALEESLDVAQSKLMILVDREEWRAIRYILSTLGKHRGFTERHEIAATGCDTESLRKQIEEDMRRVYGNEEGDEDQAEE